MKNEDVFDFLNSSRLRICFIMFLAFIVFSVLGIRLWTMQVHGSDEYNSKSDQQSVRRIRIPAVRGRILARGGEPLADNRISYDIKLHFSELRKSNMKETVDGIMELSEKIAKSIGRKNTLTRKKVIKNMNLAPGIPMTLFTDLSDAELAELWEMMNSLEGIEISAEPVRSYPQGQTAAHVIGYTGAGNPMNEADRLDYFYYLSDVVGRAGLEKIYDFRLRGRPGNKLVFVNSGGFVHDEKEKPVEPVNGYDVLLTLELKAQKLAEKVLAGYAGAMVVLDAETGAVVAMASAPTYDPSDFVPFISHEKFAMLNNDMRRPFLNRATSGSYMPGSIIKPLTALALLNNGIDAETTVDCTGRTQQGYGSIGCSNKYGHGEIDMRRAIMKSCNVYFVDLAVQLGIDKLSEEFKSAGIGEKTGIELGELPGVLPQNGPGWNEKETAYVGFGQGRIEVTPLQAASYMGAIANGGTLYRPYVVEHVKDNSLERGSVSVFDAVPVKRGELKTDKESLEIVREGMYLVVNSDEGSGRAAKNGKVELYGKTGTADVIKGSIHYKNVWFAGFAKHKSSGRLLSFALIIEHGASGGGTAAPLIGEFFENLFPEP